MKDKESSSVSEFPCDDVKNGLTIILSRKEPEMFLKIVNMLIDSKEYFTRLVYPKLEDEEISIQKIPTAFKERLDLVKAISEKTYIVCLVDRYGTCKANVELTREPTTQPGGRKVIPSQVERFVSHFTQSHYQIPIFQFGEHIFVLKLEQGLFHLIAIPN